ncbi:ABC transporter permease subunit [Agrobacterium vitis]|uniref:ABC transporter permease subunit n=2 Tax=Rhizobiaceae TaxID=82115 RepID=A0A368NEL9_AGRVI|nr:ABC transporter permease subunit [Agrobacterium vitis]KAA3525983.1 ABC transporter permease subunit [Agrobacterium vitis]MCF1478303.1 ABC transporter permease subunit [Agrobacterium vitis]MUZ99064.1 ABC transporter permease subunit [Agrobacterium vitis]MVA31664.1 ABC transporter permease subunit [Agrobacterium vitis]
MTVVETEPHSPASASVPNSSRPSAPTFNAPLPSLPIVEGSRPQPAPRPKSLMNWDWLGVLPFFLFAILFLIGPILYLVKGSFQNPAGDFTLENFISLATPNIMAAYSLSLRLSLAAACLGAIAGLLVGYAIILGGLPRWVRTAFMTFSGVASNFAGIPLAFAFIATLGRLGLVTVLLRDMFGFNLYGTGFSLFSFWGLAITYLYFQLPLMVLIITPALDGLKGEWREAAEILGATRRQYWQMVALPVLTPSILGCFLLLFANAFGTLVTVYALTGSSFGVVPIVLYQQIQGNVLYNPNLGYALAVGMVAIMAVTNTLYLILRSRAERWQK